MNPFDKYNPFEPGFVFRVFVPGGEARAASEIMMRYEHGEISI
jgi:hypothetical protein